MIVSKDWIVKHAFLKYAELESLILSFSHGEKMLVNSIENNSLDKYGRFRL
jgi:hypothetical protein